MVAKAKVVRDWLKASGEAKPNAKALAKAPPTKVVSLTVSVHVSTTLGASFSFLAAAGSALAVPGGGEGGLGGGQMSSPFCRTRDPRTTSSFKSRANWFLVPGATKDCRSFEMLLAYNKLAWPAMLEGISLRPMWVTSFLMNKCALENLIQKKK